MVVLSFFGPLDAMTKISLTRKYVFILSVVKRSCLFFKHLLLPTLLCFSVVRDFVENNAARLCAGGSFQVNDARPRFREGEATLFKG